MAYKPRLGGGRPPGLINVCGGGRGPVRDRIRSLCVDCALMILGGPLVDEVGCGWLLIQSERTLSPILRSEIRITFLSARRIIVFDGRYCGTLRDLEYGSE